MIKALLKKCLHAIFGFQNFLYLFSTYKARTIKYDKNESDILLFLTEVNKLNVITTNAKILDVGANIGIMTQVMYAQTTFNIDAFEPLALNYNVLEKIVVSKQMTNRVNIYKMALGNSDGYCDMVIPVVNNIQMHGLSHVLDDSIKEFNEGVAVSKVPLYKLDTIYANSIHKIVGIKIDVENFEYECLKGAINMLKQHKPFIYIELWDNQNRYNSFDLLRNIGYKSYYVQNGRLQFFDGNVKRKQTFIFKV